MRLSLSCFTVKVQALRSVNFVKQIKQIAFSVVGKWRKCGGFYRFIYGFRCFGIRFVRFGTRFGGFGVVFRRFECLKTVLYIREAAEVRLGVPKWLWVRGFAWRVAAVMWLVFFIFYVLFAGIRLRMWCLRLAMRRKCGSECRIGCGNGGLRGGLRRLPVAVSGLSVVVSGFVVMFGLFPVGNGWFRVGNRGCLRWVCFVFVW